MMRELLFLLGLKRLEFHLQGRRSQIHRGFVRRRVLDPNVGAVLHEQLNGGKSIEHGGQVHQRHARAIHVARIGAGFQQRKQSFIVACFNSVTTLIIQIARKVIIGRFGLRGETNKRAGSRVWSRYGFGFCLSGLRFGSGLLVLGFDLWLVSGANAQGHATRAMRHSLRLCRLVQGRFFFRLFCCFCLCNFGLCWPLGTGILRDLRFYFAHAGFTNTNWLIESKIRNFYVEIGTAGTECFPTVSAVMLSFYETKVTRAP